MTYVIIKFVKDNIPGLQPLLMNYGKSLVEKASVNPGASSVSPTKFQFPFSHHPLSELIDTIELMKDGRLNSQQFAKEFARFYVSLDASSESFRTSLQDTYTLSKFCEILNQSTDKSVISSGFNELSLNLRNRLAGHIYELSKDPWKGGEGWGMDHALDDFQCLKDATLRLVSLNCLHICQEKIRDYAIQKLHALSQDERDRVYGSIYQIAGRPKTTDLKWGEHEATANTKRLISGLHCQAKIGGPLKNAQYLKNWETEGGNYSLNFTIDGKELQCGEIGYINGAGTDYTYAIGDAYRIREAHCQGHAMHCVYASDQGTLADASSVTLAHTMQILPQARLLIQRWTEFFEKAGPNEKYLQICMSRGAIDVAAALAALPEELKKRILVIAIAPAYIIENTTCCKAINLIIKEDPIPFIAPNSPLIGKACEVKILPRHTDCANQHDPHGSSYRTYITPLVDQYIRTNDIDFLL